MILFGEEKKFNIPAKKAKRFVDIISEYRKREVKEMMKVMKCLRKMVGFASREVLVEISIIVLLAGMFYPSLSQAEGKSKYKHWMEYKNNLRKDPNLVAYYDFEQGKGYSLKNIAVGPHGDKFDGTIDGATWTTGRWAGKGALEFDGDDYVDCGDVNLEIGTDEITIEVWTIFPTGTGYHGIVANTYAGKANGFTIFQWSHNDIGFKMGDGEMDKVLGSDKPITPDHWHHIVGVRRKGTMYIYIDGVEQRYTKIQTLGLSEYALEIGRLYSSWDGHYFKGKIDEVAIYNRALTKDEIKLHYEMGSPLKKKNKMTFLQKKIKEFISIRVGNYAYAEGVKEGKLLIKIVTASDACRMVEFAAQELQTYIEKISGVKLPIEKISPTDELIIEKDKKYIFVGESPYTKKLGLKVSGLKSDGFKIIAKDNWLALLGRDYKGKPMRTIRTQQDQPNNCGAEYSTKLRISGFGETGTLYSVYHFLERYLGIRWFMPGEIGEVVPKRTIGEIIEILEKGINYQKEPDFEHRWRSNINFGIGTDAALWYKKAGFGNPYPLQINHSFYFFEKYKDSHPEYFVNFGKGKGRGRYQNLCLTEPGVLNQFVKDIRQYFDQHPEQYVYPVMPMDCSTTGDQTDERLKGIRDDSMGIEKGWKYAHGEYSDYLWGFVDKVAKEVYKTHPDKMIGCCAYSDYTIPPKKIKRFNPNVAVMICKFRKYNVNKKWKAEYDKLVEAWSKKCSNLYVWEYYNHYYVGDARRGTPVFFPRCIAEDLKSLKGISKGEKIEAEVTKLWWQREMEDIGMTHLNDYVTAKYLWDADQDIDKLLDDYYEKFYGPAKEEMKKFFTMAEEIFYQKTASVDINFWVGYLFRFSNKEVKELMGYLRKAKEKAGNTIYGKRVELMLSEASQMEKGTLEVTSKLLCVPLPLSAEKEKGLVGYWKFDKGEGKRVRDISGNNNRGKIHNARWLKYKYGSALYFNGKDSYVEIPDAPSLCPGKEVTIMGWFFYRAKPSKDVGLIWKNKDSFSLCTGANNQVTFHIYNNSGGKAAPSFSQECLVIPGWNHIAATYNGNKVKLYRNSELKGEGELSGKIRYPDPRGSLYIGKRGDNTGAIYFKGIIDEVKVYKRALTASEIKAEVEKVADAFLQHERGE